MFISRLNRMTVFTFNIRMNSKFLHERLAKTEIAGMGVIVCAVAMVVVYSRMDRGKREIVGMAGDAVE